MPVPMSLPGIRDSLCNPGRPVRRRHNPGGDTHVIEYLHYVAGGCIDAWREYKPRSLRPNPFSRLADSPLRTNV